jgi:hypothetical protein
MDIESVYDCVYCFALVGAGRLRLWCLRSEIVDRGWPLDLGALKVSQHELAGGLLLSVNSATGIVTNAIGGSYEKTERDLWAGRLRKK